MLEGKLIFGFGCHHARHLTSHHAANWKLAKDAYLHALESTLVCRDRQRLQSCKGCEGLITMLTTLYLKAFLEWIIRVDVYLLLSSNPCSAFDTRHNRFERPNLVRSLDVPQKHGVDDAPECDNLSHLNLLPCMQDCQSRRAPAYLG